jgi:L-methionine (R)-S-oxide reductase
MANGPVSMAEGLGDVARLLASSEHLDDHWPELAARIAALLDVAHCAIVLAGSGARTLRAYGCAGSMRKPAGVPQRVLTKAGAMLAQTQPSALRYNTADNAIFMPICGDGVMLGVLYVQGKQPFTATHFDTSQAVALLIGKALHLGRLQIILNSRFAQLALLQQPTAGAIALRHSGDTATLMARAFYKEMANAGFPPPDIIGAASAIIGAVTDTLKLGEKCP